MSNAWDSAAILRRCGRCCEWLPIGEYRGLDKLCRECVPMRAKLIGATRTRNIVLTPSGRDLLRQIRGDSVA